MPVSARARDFFFELMIIFIGVTAAFAAENLRESYVERQVAADIYRAHEADLDRFATYTPTVVARIDSLLTSFEAARQKGEWPALPFYREPGAEGPPLAVWEATTASGGASLIDTGMFYKLALFYNRMESVRRAYQRYSRFGESEVVPVRLDDPAGFYAADGSLRPRYRANLQQLKHIQSQLRELSAQAASLRDETERARQDLEGLL